MQQLRRMKSIKQIPVSQVCLHLGCYFIGFSHLAELAASLAAEREMDVVDVSIC